MEKDLRRPRFFFFEELPNDVGSVSPHMLSKGTNIEHVLHRFHRPRATSNGGNFG